MGAGARAVAGAGEKKTVAGQKRTGSATLPSSDDVKNYCLAIKIFLVPPHCSTWNFTRLSIRVVGNALYHLPAICGGWASCSRHAGRRGCWSSYYYYKSLQVGYNHNMGQKNGRNSLYKVHYGMTRWQENNMFKMAHQSLRLGRCLQSIKKVLQTSLNGRKRRERVPYGTASRFKI